MSDASAFKDGNLIIFTLAISVLGATVVVAQHRKTPFDDIFDEAGRVNNIDSDLLRAIAKKESDMRPEIVTDEGNGHHSYGIAQILDTTAKALGIKDYLTLLNPINGIHTQARILKENKVTLGSRYSVDSLIASYNAGPDLTPWPAQYVADVKQHYYLYKIGRQIV